MSESSVVEQSKPPKVLSTEEDELLAKQNSRLVSQFKANQLELNARKNWDLFYKRNDTRFFRDRHWTTREFSELISPNDMAISIEHPKQNVKCTKRTLLEVGCGVGNFIFPLIEDKFNENYFIYACDFSERAINFVKQNPLYDETMIKAFQCDITIDTIFNEIANNSLDIISMIFVLSAIHPKKFAKVLMNLYRLLKPGAMLLFRDYGRYDMAQIRFKAGNKIADNFYVRQDGTRSYYFTIDEIEAMADECGFDVVVNEYIYRKTINIKENIDKDRIFVQSKLRKPSI